MSISSPGKPVAHAAQTCTSVHLACTPWARLRGLHALPSWAGVLVLAPCRDIHTWFVPRAIDVAFVNATGVVVQTYRSMPPWKRRRCKDACYVMERWAQPADAWFSVGQRLYLSAEEAPVA